jgi:hypothetical protein
VKKSAFILIINEEFSVKSLKSIMLGSEVQWKNVYRDNHIYIERLTLKQPGE